MCYQTLALINSEFPFPAYGFALWFRIMKIYPCTCREMVAPTRAIGSLVSGNPKIAPRSSRLTRSVLSSRLPLYTTRGLKTTGHNNNENRKPLKGVAQLARYAI